MTELGSGPSLDEQWDLYVDNSSGDVAISEGDEEVRKDLALIVGRALTGEVGGALTPGDVSDVQLTVKKLVLSDPRIDSVDRIDASIPDDTGDSIEIDVTATTIDGTTIDDVFTV